MKRLKKLSRKIASKTFSSNSKSGASAVTKVYSERLNTLRNVEGVFYNLSNNFIEMAKAMDASTTTLEETKDSLRQQINEKQRADEEASLEKKSNKEKLFSKVVSIEGDNSSSLFDQIAQSLQTIVDVLSVSASSPDLPDVDKGKDKGKSALFDDAKENREAALYFNERGGLNVTEDRSQFVALDGECFVDHDERCFLQAIALAGL